MRKMSKLAALALALLLTVTLAAGCGGGSTGGETVDLSALSLEELEQKAKEEGHIESVGMPDDWANWGDSWATFTERYGITHNDTDMASSEELATFEAEKDSATRDIGDVGHGHGPVAIEMDVVQGYKPSTWDSIPDWAKDPDGRWIITYVGTMAILLNNDLAGQDVRSWQELKDSDIKVTPGDVAAGMSSQMAVLSAAYAFGGDIEYVQPGIDFFVNLAQAGRIDNGTLSQQRFAMGEIAATLHWDYNTLAWRDLALESNPGMNISTHVFSDGPIQSGYCLVFNKYAPHPHATALMIEYLLSDEGQLDRVKGYANPVRDIEIPEEIQKDLIPREEYENTIPVTDVEKLTVACELISEKWQDEVMPLL